MREDFEVLSGKFDANANRTYSCAFILDVAVKRAGTGNPHHPVAFVEDIAGKHVSSADSDKYAPVTVVLNVTVEVDALRNGYGPGTLRKLG